jgi:hypothetical protein
MRAFRLPMAFKNVRFDELMVRICFLPLPFGFVEKFKAKVALAHLVSVRLPLLACPVVSKRLGPDPSENGRNRSVLIEQEFE